MKLTTDTLKPLTCSQCTYPHIHSDQEAMTEIAKKLPNHNVVDINQCEEKILVRNTQGELVVFSYNLRLASNGNNTHFDYHIHGDITAHEHLIKELFPKLNNTDTTGKTNTMHIRTNQDRAESAYRAVEKFSDTTGLEAEEMFVKISDLLCNLRHLADEQGIDFNDCQEQADRHYESEIAQ